MYDIPTDDVRPKSTSNGRTVATFKVNMIQVRISEISIRHPEANGFQKGKVTFWAFVKMK
jgi:hypothetical protein